MATFSDFRTSHASRSGILRADCVRENVRILDVRIAFITLVTRFYVYAHSAVQCRVLHLLHCIIKDATLDVFMCTFIFHI